MKKNTNQNGFQCMHCGTQIVNNPYMGTSQRNHCPYCLWSKHVDKEQPGDRLSDCKGEMKPYGLTFKHKGIDKYGKQKQGELMIVHVCEVCGKININRIAGNDNEQNILMLLDVPALSPGIHSKIQEQGISILDTNDAGEVHKQIFGLKAL